MWCPRLWHHACLLPAARWIRAQAPAAALSLRAAGGGRRHAGMGGGGGLRVGGGGRGGSAGARPRGAARWNAECQLLDLAKVSEEAPSAQQAPQRHSRPSRAPGPLFSPGPAESQCRTAHTGRIGPASYCARRWPPIRSWSASQSLFHAAGVSPSQLDTMQLGLASRRAVAPKRASRPAAGVAVSAALASRCPYRAVQLRSRPGQRHGAAQAARGSTRAQAAALELGTRAIKRVAQISKNPVFVAGASS